MLSINNLGNKSLVLLAFLLLSVVSIQPAIGHSGGTDSAGCHENTDTGIYHCH